MKIKREYLSLILLVMALFFATLLFNSDANEFSDFSLYVISWASVNNIDASRRITFYFLFLSSVFGGMLVLPAFNHQQYSGSPHEINRIITKKDSNCNNHINPCLLKVRDRAILIVVLILCLLMAFVIEAIVAKVLLILIPVILFCLLKNEAGSISKAGSVFVCAVSLIHVLLYICGLFGIEIILLENPYITFGVIVIVACFLCIYNHSILINGFSWFGVLSTLWICLFTEISYVNKFNGLFSNNFPLIFLVGIIMIILFVALFAGKTINKLLVLKHTLFILGLAWISFIRIVPDVYTYNMFEDANHGVSICGFVFYNKIPIVDTFDAHMLSNSGLGLLYYFISGDYYGALTSPYSYLFSIVLFVALFLTLRFFVSDELAIVVTALFNSGYFVAHSIALPNSLVFMSGIIMIPVLVLAVRKPSLKHCILLWLLAELLVFVSFDVGIAFGIPAIILMIYQHVKTKDYSGLGRFLLCGLFLGLITIFFFFVLISIKYNVSDWMKQFISLISSNQQWLFEHIDPFNMMLFYMFLPSAVFFAYRYIKSKGFLNPDQDLVIAFLFLSFLLNSPRLVIRHTINEDLRYVTCIILFILFLLAVHLITKRVSLMKQMKGNIALYYAFPIVMISLLISSIGNTDLYNSSMKITESTKYLRSENTYPSIYNASKIEEVSIVLTSLLRDGETFFDFSNNTELYPLLKMDNPIYPNQCPALINGLQGQIATLDYLKSNKDKVPIVLMISNNSFYTYQMDYVANEDRYFLIADFIFSNYKPIYASDNYELWCLNERYDEYADVINSDNLCISTNYKEIIHNLGVVPYYWARQLESKIVTDEYQYCIECMKLSIDSSCQQTVNVIIEYDDGSNELYSFVVYNGIHNYVIPLGNTYSWHSSIVNSMYTINSNVTILECAVVNDRF